MKFPAAVKRSLERAEVSGPRGQQCTYGRVCNICMREACRDIPGIADAVTWAEIEFGFGPPAADALLSLLVSEEFAS